MGVTRIVWLPGEYGNTLITIQVMFSGKPLIIIRGRQKKIKYTEKKSYGYQENGQHGYRAETISMRYPGNNFSRLKFKTSR